MRFNWDGAIPAVRMMYDDPEIAPISGTGFSTERLKDGSYRVTFTPIEDGPVNPDQSQEKESE